MARRTPPGQPVRSVTPPGARRHLHIFTEGQATEDSYFQYLRRQQRYPNVTTGVDPRHGTPLQLVQFAIKLATGPKVERADAYWCVFDKDDHAVDEALGLAAAHQIQIAFSNPCIELWFILHFESQTSHISTYDASKRAGDLLGTHEKRVPEAALRRMDQGFDIAARRAQDLANQHAANGHLEHHNPSTGMWRLVSEIRGADTP